MMTAGLPLTSTAAIPWWDLEIATPLADIYTACLHARNQFNRTGTRCRMREETFRLMAENANTADLHGRRGLWDEDKDADDLSKINRILSMNSLPKIVIDPTVPDGVVLIDGTESSEIIATIRT
jgi:hypothetical protein